MDKPSEKNIHEMLKKAVERWGDRPCLRGKTAGKWETWSWNEMYSRVRNASRSFIALGLKRGDRFNVMSYTRPQFVLADWGAVIVGGVCVTIYQSNTPAETEYIINNCGSRFLFAENGEILDKVRQVKASCPTLEKVIVFDPCTHDEDWVLSWEDFMNLGKDLSDEEVARRTDELTQEDLAGFVYTSGTTGPPKGVVSTHLNWLAVTQSVKGALSADETDEVLLLLPLAHIFARLIQYTALRVGYTVAHAESIEKAIDNIGEIHPTVVPAVPRIFEKAYTKIQATAEQGSGLKKGIFHWALATGKKVSKLRQQGQEPSGVLALQYAIAHKLVFSKVAQRFGGRVRFFVSGGAPLSRDIAEFFHAAGLLILEGYGMTENTSLSNCNRFKKYKFGSVGPAVDGVEVRIADDGEILTRGHNTMAEYYQLPEATAEALDSEGWLHTGDIGEIDADGFLKITDRKKDIIITAGGKNVAPQNIENQVKTDNLISQVMVHGDKRKFISALITLDRDEVAKWCQDRSIPCSTDQEFEALAENAQVKTELERRVADYNQKLASYEQIKKIAVIPGDFTQDAGEITPTLKLKRKVITTKYLDLLDSFYDEKH
ncbi:MAG: long-chain fatty acid--CoA ligase [Armatimonadetes bacterium]|nr:long-chain fatty acid--CoA ligase [Armatimonadota bacterium]